MIVMMREAVSKTELPSIQVEITLGSSLPGTFSVHIVVDLDNNEMDCFRSFDFIILITSNWYNQCVQWIWQTSGPKWKSWVKQIRMLFNSCVCLKKTSLALGPALLPGLIAYSMASNMATCCLLS